MSCYLAESGDFGGLFLGGELAPAGLYQRLGTPHTISLNEPELLPSSREGHVVCYAKVRSTKYADHVESQPKPTLAVQTAA